MTTIRDPRIRRRLGLSLIRVGGRFIGAYERDVIAIEQRGWDAAAGAGDGSRDAAG